MMGGHSSRQLREQAKFFKHRFVHANADFQVEHDYDTHQSAGGNRCCGSNCDQKKTLTIATDYVEDKFACLSLFLEMPFKTACEYDIRSALNPHQVCSQLGSSILQPIQEILDMDRRETDISSMQA